MASLATSLNPKPSKQALSNFERRPLRKTQEHYAREPWGKPCTLNLGKLLGFLQNFSAWGWVFLIKVST